MEKMLSHYTLINKWEKHMTRTSSGMRNSWEQKDSESPQQDLTADINEPTYIEDAFSGEHYHQWKEATKSEYDSLVGNNTWELVPPPDGKNVVGSRWVFKVKRDADGSVQRFKARLVAQGYSQSNEIDYQEVFSPVARYNSIRALFAVANACDWDFHQMDVKTAFLQGDLDEEIFMKQPEGYIDVDSTKASMA